MRGNVVVEFIGLLERISAGRKAQRLRQLRDARRISHPVADVDDVNLRKQDRG
jgi:hypothetical protein